MKRVALASLFILLSIPAHAASPGGAVEGTLHERALLKTLQLVYLEKVDADEATQPTDGATMNQKSNIYVPHVLPIVAGTRVAFQTMDPELHNIYAKAGESVLFNTALPAGAPLYNKAFKTPGIVALTCNIHSEMSAFIVVLQNRHFAQPDPKTGAWKIDGIPPGRYTVKVWGEKLDDALLKHEFPITITPGATTPLDIAAHPAS